MGQDGFVNVCCFFQMFDSKCGRLTKYLKSAYFLGFPLTVLIVLRGHIKFLQEC